jgi:ribosome-interacting GTPase 1
MPANLTHQYKEAERRYRQATTPEEQAAALSEMLALIPKHKGTDKLQADIKRRMAQLRKERGKSSAVSRQRPVYVIDIEGAGQVPVLGGPNSGKSALVGALTNAHLQVAEYPYTTQQPAPAMMPFEDAQVQLIDTPPASEEYAPPWIPELVRRADAVLLLADLSAADGWEPPAFITEQLVERGIELVAARVEEPAEGAGDDTGQGGEPESDSPESSPEDPEDDEGLTFRVPTILVGCKSDSPESGDGLTQLVEYFGARFPVLSTSVADRASLQELRRSIFRALKVIRVYSREPGKHTEKGRPWLLHEGSTVHDLANLIHHDLAERFQFGRLWGSGRFDGQRVGEDYVLADRDIVEIHAR